MRSSYVGLIGGLVFSIVLVYMLIVVNFQSWLDPFIIITALPAALAGIVCFSSYAHDAERPGSDGRHYVHGRRDGEQHSRGLLRERARYAEHQRRRFKQRSRPGTTRFRPVCMTALAMIIGMIPMALGLGEAANRMRHWDAR